MCCIKALGIEASPKGLASRDIWTVALRMIRESLSRNWKIRVEYHRSMSSEANDVPM
jgi:hypothetical protein